MVKIKITTISLPKAYLVKIRELIQNEKYPSRSKLVRIAIKKLLKKELVFYSFLQELNYDISDNWSRIISVNLPKKYINIIGTLVQDIYPSRSELIRVAVHDLLIEELKEEKEKDNNESSQIQKEIESKIIRRLEIIKETKERKPRKLIEQYKNPEKLLKIYQYEINRNLIISFLNEINGEMKDAYELQEIMGMDNSMVKYTINLILKDYPLLINKKHGNSNLLVYSLNREELKRVMEVS